VKQNIVLKDVSTIMAINIMTNKGKRNKKFMYVEVENVLLAWFK
jgi:hypothetical protein